MIDKAEAVDIVVPDFSRWSISALTCIQRCGEQFKRRYLDKERVPQGIKGKRGTVVHYIAKESHKVQMKQRGAWVGDEPTLTEMPGTPKATQEAADMAATVFTRELSGGVTYTKEETAIGIKSVNAHEKDVAVDLSKLYVSDVAAPVNPIGVERRIEVKPKDSAISVLGFIDLVEGTPKGAVIRDLKTAEKSPHEDAAKHSGQLTMYSMIHRAETGSLPIESRLIHLVRTPKTAQLKVVEQVTKRDEEDVRMLVQRINIAVDAVKKGVFVPADPGIAG